MPKHPLALRQLKKKKKNQKQKKTQNKTKKQTNKQTKKNNWGGNHTNENFILKSFDFGNWRKSRSWACLEHARSYVGPTPVIYANICKKLLECPTLLIFAADQNR